MTSQELGTELLYELQRLNKVFAAEQQATSLAEWEMTNQIVDFALNTPDDLISESI